MALTETPGPAPCHNYLLCKNSLRWLVAFRPSPAPSNYPFPSAWGSHRGAVTLGLAPATGRDLALDEGLHSILKDTAHCPSHHVGTPVPAGTTSPGPEGQRHMPQSRALRLPEGLREGQKMKGPWGPVGARALAGAAPPTPSCTDESIKTFQDRRRGTEWKTTTTKS